MGTTLDSVAESGNRKGRLNYSAEFKQKIVTAASAPGASVSRVAMVHQLNANMVFRWRRELGAGATGTREVAAQLLPVVLDRRPAVAPLAAPAAQRTTAECPIEVWIGDACVRIFGKADPDMLRAVLQGVRP